MLFFFSVSKSDDIKEEVDGKPEGIEDKEEKKVMIKCQVNNIFGKL